jgi:hypothetical protein
MLKGYCPRARSDMTQCYFKEGDIAVGRNTAGEELCIGCGWLLSAIPKTINAAEIGYDIDWYLEKGGQMLDLDFATFSPTGKLRWDRFLAHYHHELFVSGGVVGTAEAEEKLRDLWHKTPKD